MDNNQEHSTDRESKTSQPPQRADTWQFMVFNDLHTAMSKKSRHRVRSQAMRHYHRRARDPLAQGVRPLRRNELELDITPLLGRSSIHYPITMPNRENELCDHLLDRTCVMFRTMQDIGFLDRVRQTPAFGQLLAISSWHLIKHLNQSRSASEHLQLSLSATQALQMQINDPLTCISDDAICAVLVFACCANMIHDTTALNAHMHGVNLILDLRGGLHTLNHNPVLRIMLHWVDVNGACFQDEPPQFPPPLHLLPEPRPELFFCNPNTTSEPDYVSRICEAVRDVQALIREENRSRNVWQHATFQGFHIIPILGQILAIRSQRLSDELETVNTSFELFRLAAIIYINALRSLFGVDTLITKKLYASKIHDILTSTSAINKFPPMPLAWVLSVAFTSNCNTNRKHYFERALVDLIGSLGIASFEELRDILMMFVWDEDLLASQSFSLRTLFTCQFASTQV